MMVFFYGLLLGLWLGCVGMAFFVRRAMANFKEPK